MKKTAILLSAILLILAFSLPAFAGKTGGTTIPAESKAYVILGANDLGMHCDQDDYSSFMVLPPANTVRVQVFKRGNNNPVTSGITVSYSFAKRTKVPSTYTNFWTYASQFGFNVAVNQGISGNYMTGNFVADAANYSWNAEYIPLVPYNDSGTFDPYPYMTVTVKDTAGVVLATANIVVPVSSEMSCFRCHGTTNTYNNILQSHDTLQGTKFVADKAAGKLHACSECHKDNALGRAGVNGVKPLSEAMHNFHAAKIAALPRSQQLDPVCYNCHPGPNTKCMRGAMQLHGKTCTTCHGDMANVANTQTAGRQAWLQEPKCGDCHSRYLENANTLYRNSKLTTSPAPGMNGKMYCETCHGSTHAEWPTNNSIDNALPISLQNVAAPINGACKVCHTTAQTSTTVHR